MCGKQIQQAKKAHDRESSFVATNFRLLDRRTSNNMLALMCWPILICVFALPIPRSHAAQKETSEKLIVSRHIIDRPIIDGKLDDAVWAQGAVLTEFHEVLPDEYDMPSESMEIRVLHDDQFIYVAAVLYVANPEKISAFQMVQGKTYDSDDRFHVVLDTFHDRRNGYFFQLNPNGVRRDALILDNSKFIEEWDGIWLGKSRIDKDRWTAEMAIPFKSLSFNPNRSTWGINFGRVIASNGELISWASQGINVKAWAPSAAGQIRGLDGLKQGLGLDIRPGITFTGSKEFANGKEDAVFEPSLDIFYKPTPTVTIAGTINTNFSSTESDEAQVNLSRFSIQLPEKREFFLQDAGVFEFAGLTGNGRPFFSRRIGLSGDGRAIDIDGGIKLTGRYENMNFGLLSVVEDPSMSDGSGNLLVGRVTTNIWEESSVGVIVTHGNPSANQSNSLVGTDFLYRSKWGDGEVIQARTWLQQTDSEDVFGNNKAFGAEIRLPNDKHSAHLSFAEIQDNFNPALGFVNRNGTRTYSVGYAFRKRPDYRSIESTDAWLGYDLITNQHNQLESQSISFGTGLSTRAQDLVGYQFNQQIEVVDTPFNISEGVIIPVGRYEFRSHNLFYGTGVHRKLSIDGEFNWGEFFGGHRTSTRLITTIKPNKHLSISAGLEVNQVRLPLGDFITRLGSVRADLAFNSSWAWLNFVQYDNVSGIAIVNSRLRWSPDAGKEFFVVLKHAFSETNGSFNSAQTEIGMRFVFTFRY